jgi:hypothetical protein
VEEGGEDEEKRKVGWTENARVKKIGNSSFRWRLKPPS